MKFIVRSLLIILIIGVIFRLKLPIVLMLSMMIFFVNLNGKQEIIIGKTGIIFAVYSVFLIFYLQFCWDDLYKNYMTSQIIGNILICLILFRTRIDDIVRAMHVFIGFALLLSILWYLSLYNKNFEWLLLKTYNDEDSAPRFANGWMRMYNPAFLLLGLVPQKKLLDKIGYIIAMIPSLAPFSILSVILNRHRWKFTILLLATTWMVIYNFPNLLESIMIQKEISYQLREERLPEFCWINGCDSLEYLNENFYIAMTQYFGLIWAILYGLMFNAFLLKLSGDIKFLILANIVILANPVPMILVGFFATYWKGGFKDKVKQKLTR